MIQLDFALLPTQLSFYLARRQSTYPFFTHSSKDGLIESLNRVVNYGK